MKRSLPVRKALCATCPFREGSIYAHLRSDLTDSAINQGSRICHSTGGNNAINRRTGKPPMICRGARNAQLQMFYRIGFLSEPTDAAWNAKTKEINKHERHT